MVTIRLSRGGARNRPFFHVVVTDSRSKRDGRYIERLGFFNPIAATGETGLDIDLERLQHWQSRGAKVSERVEFLVSQLRSAGKAA